MAIRTFKVFFKYSSSVRDGKIIETHFSKLRVKLRHILLERSVPSENDRFAANLHGSMFLNRGFLLRFHGPEP